jgi:hypothetical protein
VGGERDGVGDGGGDDDDDEGRCVAGAKGVRGGWSSCENWNCCFSFVLFFW